MKITAVRAHEIFDSRGLPTISCAIELDTGSTVFASVPSGASRGSGEALELRDGGSRLFGRGVQHAVDCINTKIGPTLIGKQAVGHAVDTVLLSLDPTADKSIFGANTLLAVSIAVHRAQAVSESDKLYTVLKNSCHNTLPLSLPSPWFNIINGGMHATNSLRIQEIMVCIQNVATVKQKYEIAVEIFYTVQAILRKKKIFFGIGDEGGISALFGNEEALDILMQAIEELALTAQGIRIGIALDMAASHFYNTQTRTYCWNTGEISTTQLLDWYQKITTTYPIIALEDPFAETDFDGWRAIFSNLSERIMIVGDDICVTHPDLITQYAQEKCINSCIIKPNQIGTITQAFQAVTACQKQVIPYIASHRSGETNDDFIADFCVGIGAPFIKAGGCSRGERIAKYNRLIAIEEQIKNF